MGSIDGFSNLIGKSIEKVDPQRSTARGRCASTLKVISYVPAIAIAIIWVCEWVSRFCKDFQRARNNSIAEERERRSNNFNNNQRGRRRY